MPSLNSYLDILESHFPNFEYSNENVSKASVGWHLEHSLLVINGITSTLSKSEPELYKWKFNFKRMFVWTTGKIPRGKGTAPSTVQPKEEITLEGLKSQLEKTRTRLVQLEALSEDKFFEHPYFGQIKKKDTVKFLGIHTKHHLTIVADMLKD